MKRLWQTFSVAVVLAIVGAGVMLAFAVESEPLVHSAPRLDPETVRRARAIVREHDPRHLAEGGIRDMVLLEDELNLAFGYALARMLGGSIEMSVAEGTLRAQATFPLADAGFANVDILLSQTSTLPRIDTLRIGGLKVPGAAATWVMKTALRQGPELADGTSFAALVRAVKFETQRLEVTYEWRSDLLDQLRASVLEDADRDRIEVYHRALVMAAKQLRAGESASALMSPLFKLALDRSAREDPVAENRAVLVVLSAYTSGRTLARLIPEASGWPRALNKALRLHGRRDLAQHFLISAGLSAIGGSALADAVGLFKEVDDSRFGSGFSFSDIAADRAGTRFGELALSTPASAARVQRWLARGVTDFDLLPHPRDLPDYLKESEFQKRFGEVDSPAYKAVMADIEVRISALGFYRRDAVP